MKRIVVAVASVLLLAGNAAAAAPDIDFVRPLAQGAFKSFAREAGAAVAYRNAAPAAPLGLTGFDVGIEGTAVDIEQGADYWNAATGDDAPSLFVVPKVRARKGLPFGIDVGAMFSLVPQSNVRLFGVELSKALLDGGVALPAIGLRATYTRLVNVESLDLQTAGLDASISKGFLIFTPYAGAGLLWIDAKANDPVLAGLERERFTQPRFFGGVEISPLPFFGITAEVEYSEIPMYTVKAAIGF